VQTEGRAPTTTAQAPDEPLGRPALFRDGPRFDLVIDRHEAFNARRGGQGARPPAGTFLNPGRFGTDYRELHELVGVELAAGAGR